MRRTSLFFILIAIEFSYLHTTEVYARDSESSREYKSYKGAKAIDGDTFRYKGERYRIQQYNTPELGEPGSQKAMRDLQRKLDSGNYEWMPVTKDAYGRTIVKEKQK